MVSKRGQSAAGAAVLLVIIAALIVGFIILMPPSDRADLLGEDSGTNSGTDSGSDTGIEDAVPEQNLLSAAPGRVDYLAQREVEHPLPVINLYTKTEAKVLADKNVVYAKRSSFSDETSKFNFALQKLQYTTNVFLTFDARKIEGRLIILLNGEEIFNGGVEDLTLPISLSERLLKDNNEMVFQASSPGLAFWATNEISLENVKVVADVTNVEAQSSKNVFLVSETEKKNLERVTLKFQPTCQYGEVGKLEIWINGNDIYSGVPDCDLAMVPIEVSPELIYQGENQITFNTERGAYLLSHVQIRSELKDVEFPTYYFELSHEEFQSIKDETRRLRMEMFFVDTVSSKYGDLYFNGHLYGFDTKEADLTIDISEDIVEGNNALKIKPRKTIEIRQLSIDLVK